MTFLWHVLISLFSFVPLVFLAELSEIAKQRENTFIVFTVDTKTASSPAWKLIYIDPKDHLKQVVPLSRNVVIHDPQVTSHGTIYINNIYEEETTFHFVLPTVIDVNSKCRVILSVDQVGLYELLHITFEEFVTNLENSRLEPLCQLKLNSNIFFALKSPLEDPSDLLLMRTLLLDSSEQSYSTTSTVPQVTFYRRSIKPYLKYSSFMWFLVFLVYAHDNYEKARASPLSVGSCLAAMACLLVDNYI